MRNDRRTFGTGGGVTCWLEMETRRETNGWTHWRRTTNRSKMINGGMQLTDVNNIGLRHVVSLGGVRDSCTDKPTAVLMPVRRIVG